jgi:hypothetical protein
LHGLAICGIVVFPWLLELELFILLLASLVGNYALGLWIMRTRSAWLTGLGIAANLLLSNLAALSHAEHKPLDIIWRSANLVKTTRS